ncbi:LysM peptidoglycan-binding domain-containing protein [Agromyces sp. NPDC058110]|uniref:LysM peptidoglycan-binding domain-containing protein n=1 Tax=Agromyces sp. NPDC058110 TaxID=3346345 RepID=UPI0036DC37C1
MSAVLVAGPFGSYADPAVAVEAGREPATARSHLRLTRRGRAVFTALAAIPLVLLAISFVLGSGGAAADVDGAKGAALTYLTVADGESLWSIAESLAPQADPRDIIDDIIRLNGLDGTVVQPGQRLALPAHP